MLSHVCFGGDLYSRRGKRAKQREAHRTKHEAATSHTGFPLSPNFIAPYPGQITAASLLLSFHLSSFRPSTMNRIEPPTQSPLSLSALNARSLSPPLWFPPFLQHCASNINHLSTSSTNNQQPTTASTPRHQSVSIINWGIQ